MNSLSDCNTYLQSCSIPSAVFRSAAEERLLVTVSTFSRQASMAFMWQLPPFDFLRLRERLRLFLRVDCASASSPSTSRATSSTPSQNFCILFVRIEVRSMETHTEHKLEKKKKEDEKTKPLTFDRKGRFWRIGEPNFWCKMHANSEHRRKKIKLTN